LHLLVKVPHCASLPALRNKAALLAALLLLNATSILQASDTFSASGFVKFLLPDLAASYFRLWRNIFRRLLWHGRKVKQNKGSTD